MDDRKLGVDTSPSTSESTTPADGATAVENVDPGVLSTGGGSVGSGPSNEGAGSEDIAIMAPASNEADSAAASPGGASGAGGAAGELGAGGSGAPGAGGASPEAQEPPDQCPGTPEPCGTLCVDLNSDRAHCGDCSTACGTNESCSGGECGCSGELFPCIAFGLSLPATDYGVSNVAGYRDATHDWFAYVDGTGNAGATIVVYDNAALLPMRSIPVPQWEVQLAFLANEPTLLYSSNGTLSRVTERGQPTELLTGVNWFQLSPDGQTLASSSAVNPGILTLRSYPALAIQEELTLTIAVGNQYERLAFSRDGRWLAVAGLYDSAEVQLFDLSNGSTRELRAVGATGTYSPAFSEDGGELFVGGGYADGRVYVFDTATGTELRRLTPFANYVYTVAQVPGFRQLLIGGYDGSIAIIDAVTGQEFWKDDVGSANRAIFAADGGRLYAGTGAGSGSVIVYTVR